MFALSLLTLFACESDYDREQRLWAENFGAVLRTYEDREGKPELDPSEVQGRKIMADATSLSFVKREPWEALVPEDIGLVVLDRTVNDTAPVASYSGGMKGYAGDVTVQAWAHPEGVLVAEEHYRCTPSSVAYEMDGMEIGNKCGGTREQRVRWGGELTGAINVLGSNTDWLGTRAFEELGLSYKDKLDEAVATDPPSVASRRVLVMMKGPDGWESAQSSHGADEGRLARGVGQVGVVVMQHIDWEERPSHRYQSGALSYGGVGHLVAIAHPEGVVVARAEVPCAHQDEGLINVLPGRERVYRCEVPHDVRVGFVNALL